MRKEKRRLAKGDDSHTQEPDLGAIFEQHIRHEFDDQDVDATMQQ